MGAGQDGAAGHTQNRAVELVLLLTLPAAAALTVAAEPIIRSLLQYGAFRPSDTLPTARALAAFSLGLPAYVLIKVLTPGFHARQDTRMPVRIAVASMLVNLVGNLVLVWPLGHVGIALSTAVAAWVNAGALYWVLRSRGHFHIDARLARRLPRLLAATLVMVPVLFGLGMLLAPWLGGALLARAAGTGAVARGRRYCLSWRGPAAWPIHPRRTQGAIFPQRYFCMSRVFSGIQPTGNLHLGNYLGAIRELGEDAGNQHDCVFCVVDLHAITVAQNPVALRTGIREMAAALIASGIDPDRAILFQQSQVRAHAEIAWVLMCTARVGWLNRMTQFKEKSGKDREGASVGLYTYPVLQAADILAYRATHVPVGDDQKQHLELARDIAAKFNTDMGVDVFPLPEPVIEGPATRVMSLRDGSAKMSKSDPTDASRINMTDDADAIAQKIKRAKTDADALPSEPAGLAGRPEAANLVGIMAALSDRSVAEVLRDHGGQGFGQFKPALAEVMVAALAPINARFAALRHDSDGHRCYPGQGRCPRQRDCRAGAGRCTPRRGLYRINCRHCGEFSGHSVEKAQTLPHVKPS